MKQKKLARILRKQAINPVQKKIWYNKNSKACDVYCKVWKGTCEPIMELFEQLKIDIKICLKKRFYN